MILVHGVPAALAEAIASGRPPVLPALSRLVSRGDVMDVGRTVPGWHGWHVALLDALGLAVDGVHGAALLEWLGQGGELRAGSWLKVEFVHLAIGARRSVVGSPGPLAIGEAAELGSWLAPHLRDAGFDLVSSPGSAGEAWYLHSEAMLDAFCPLPPGEESEVRDALPRGPDAARLRRLLTEVQMLLHEHPVNARRELAGRKPVNAVWLSGSGHAGPVGPAPLPALFGNDPFVRGLARRYGRDCLPVPRDEERLAAAARGCIVHRIEPGAPAAELEALDRSLLQPLVTSVQRGGLEELQLVLDGCAIRADRRALRRFWRRTSLARLQAGPGTGAGP